MMVEIGQVAGPKKIRIKLTKKIIDIESADGPNNSCEDPILGKCSNVCADIGNHAINGIQQLSDNKMNSGLKLSSRISSIVGTKRKMAEPRNIKYEQEKRRKMDTGLQHICSCIVNKLMSHSNGWAFNQPVDPVALNIPDYYSVIDNPMDLGTIKSKLLNGLYSTIEEFAADVRLTFSNAVHYNPPSNYYNSMAKTLSKFFERNWRSVLSKKVSSGLLKDDDIYSSVEVVSGRKTPLNSGGMVKETDESRKLREQLIELSKGKASQHLHEFLKSHRLMNINEDISDMDVKSFDKKTLFELNQLVSSCKKAVNINSACPKKAESCKPKELKNGFLEELSAKNSRSIIDHSLDSSDSKQIAITQNEFELCKGKSYPDSDGSGSMLDEETACPTSLSAAPMIKTSEEWVNDYLPHDKADRIAMLKNRFADTILKAQQITRPDNFKNIKTELAKSKDEPKKVHCEESDRIEVEVEVRNAAPGSSQQSKREEEMRLWRDKQREDARKALEKIERTVEVDDNMRVLKDLEKLIERGCVKSEYSPLERLGLFMREDYLHYDDDDWAKEEGEIMC